MERKQLEELFVAIKNDDEKSFSSIMLSKSDYNIRFGRFPILSLLYLYKSYSILYKYENEFLKISSFQEVFEPFDAYLKFKSKAKKSLRIFTKPQKIVFPIEMLAVLDDRTHLNNYYKFLYKNEEIQENISKIYILNQKLNLQITNDSVQISKKPISTRAKILAGLISLVFLLFTIFSAVSVVVVSENFGLGTAEKPIAIATVRDLKKLKNVKGRHYVLTQNIVITDDFKLRDFDGTLNGNQNTITISGGSNGLYDVVSGTIKNLNVKAEYSDLKIYNNFGVIASKLTGILTNCNVNCSLSASAQAETDVYVSIVAENSGLIELMNVEFNATLTNQRETNAYISVVGENSGTVQSVKTKSANVSTDTVDISGIVSVNNGTIKNSENNANLIQTSAKEWNPNVAGIAMTNNGTIENCTNNGELSSESTLAKSEQSTGYEILCGGISCTNSGTITSCINRGQVFANSTISENEKNLTYSVYAGGISGINQGLITNAECSGKVEAKSDIASLYVGGVCAIQYADGASDVSSKKCKVSAELSATATNAKVNIAGIVAFSRSNIQTSFIVYILAESVVESSGFTGSIKTDAKTAFAGGVVSENYYGSVKNSYSSATYENKRNGEESDSNYFVGGVVAGTYYYGNDVFSNNYYTKIDDNEVGINVLINYGISITVQKYQDNETISKQIASIDELPEDIVLWLESLNTNWKTTSGY